MVEIVVENDSQNKEVSREDSLNPHKYLISMKNHENFIVTVDQDLDDNGDSKDRDDKAFKLVSHYMKVNYPHTDYEIISLNNLKSNISITTTDIIKGISYSQVK